MNNYDLGKHGTIIHPSGAKTSGALPFYECLTDTFIDRCAQRMTEGAERYVKHNWKKGAGNKEYILERLRHAQKHLMLLMRQIDMDMIPQDDDAAAVCVNVMMAMEYQDMNGDKLILDLDALKRESESV